MFPANDNTDAAALPAIPSPAILTLPRRSRIEQLGPVTLILGDALEAIQSVEKVTDVCADPPYSSGGQFRGDRVQGSNAKYLGRQDAKKYADFSGDNRDQRSYGFWSAMWLAAAREATEPGGLCGVFTDWRQLPTTTDALQAGGWVWRGILPWDKTEGVRPVLGRWRNQAEYMAWGTNGPRETKGPVSPGVIRRAVDRDKAHATAKPVGLYVQLLAPMGGVILDPFMGSGSCGVACVETGRRFIGIETNPEIYEVARTRISEALERQVLAPSEPFAGKTGDLLAL